jgi:hypothetical protein
MLSAGLMLQCQLTYCNLVLMPSATLSESPGRAVRLFRIHRLQLLNSLLAVTETHDHLEDVVTHGSLQVRHDKLRSRMARFPPRLRSTCGRRS